MKSRLFFTTVVMDFLLAFGTYWGEPAIAAHIPTIQG